MSQINKDFNIFLPDLIGESPSLFSRELIARFSVENCPSDGGVSAALGASCKEAIIGVLGGGKK